MYSSGQFRRAIVHLHYFLLRRRSAQSQSNQPSTLCVQWQRACSDSFVAPVARRQRMIAHRTASSGLAFPRRVAGKFALALLFLLFAASSSRSQNSPAASPPAQRSFPLTDTAALSIAGGKAQSVEISRSQSSLPNHAGRERHLRLRQRLFHPGRRHRSRCRC